MEPLSLWRVRARRLANRRDETVEEAVFAPTFAAAFERFERLKQDRTVAKAKLEMVLLTPPTREGICAYLNGPSRDYLLEACTVDDWQWPAEDLEACSIRFQARTSGSPADKAAAG